MTTQLFGSLMIALSPESDGRPSKSRRNELDAIADFDVASASDGRVQAELPAEPANDVAQNRMILRPPVRIKRCQDATTAEVIEVDLRIREPQSRTGPPSLGHTRDPADHQVGTQAPEVAAERRHRAVGTDQQRQDV